MLFLLSQMLLTDFPETRKEDIKLILAYVLKVLRECLSPFLSYRENSGGGASVPSFSKRGAG